MNRALAGALFVLALPVSAEWFKGNTHTHTSKSDGDTAPAEVARWYADRDYDFLIITDHDQITEVSAPGILLIRGEEVTDHLPKKPLHVNALGLREVVKPQSGTSPVEVLQRNVDAIRAAGGVPVINHPNFGWAFGAAELKVLENVNLVEIASGHPLVNMNGGGGAPSMEEIWDDVLTSGVKMYGVGVDDSHYFRCGRTDFYQPLPGQSWIVVRAGALTPKAILGAMEAGDFYASTGVKLEDVAFAGSSLTISIVEEGGAKYTTEFIGSGGKVLHRSFENPAAFRIPEGQAYVRARVTDSNGRKAWVQPVFPKR